MWKTQSILLVTLHCNYSTVEDRLPLDTTDGAAMPQIALPVQGGVEAHAIGMIVSVSYSQF